MVETKKEWFVRDNWSAREPGLFKLEFEGIRRIALCSMCSFIHSFIHSYTLFKHGKSITYSYRTIKIITLIYTFALWE